MSALKYQELWKEKETTAVEVEQQLFYCSSFIRKFLMYACMYGCMHACIYVCMAITCSKSKDQPGKIVNPARGPLKRKSEYFPVPVRA